MSAKGIGKLAEALRNPKGPAQTPQDALIERIDKDKSLYLRALHLEIEAQVRRRMRRQ